MENVSMTNSEYVPESRINRTQSTPKQRRTAEKSNAPDFESVFFDNVNRSYLAKMSNNPQESMQKSKIYEKIIPNMRSRKKIDFEAFQGLETEKIYQSAFFKGEWDMFQVVSMLENSEKEVELNDEKDHFLCCAGPKHRLVCRGRITGNSQFQLIKDVAGQDCGLFFSINFDISKGQVFFHEHKVSCEIVISVDNYSLIVEPLDKRAGRYWHGKLLKMSQKGSGAVLPARILRSSPNFYRNRYETDSYFAENCENGDILLFQDNHFFAKAQRFITRSQFDHVGIVVRDKKHGILIFQSNTSSGVCLTPWKYVNMFEWYKNIPRITWRRLHTERSHHFDQALEDFVIKTLPRQFHFSLAKLTAQESFVMVNESRREGELELGETNGYFCSQLTAATYKHLGLLATDKNNPNYLPASRYYPLDFTEKGEIKLEVGYLGEQRDIIFQNEIK